MTIFGWLQIALVLITVLLLAKPLGLSMARVFSGEQTWLSPVLVPVETGFYRLAGVRPDKQQSWLGYAVNRGARQADGGDARPGADRSRSGSAGRRWQ